MERNYYPVARGVRRDVLFNLIESLDEIRSAYPVRFSYGQTTDDVYRVEIFINEDRLYLTEKDTMEDLKAVEDAIERWIVRANRKLSKGEEN